MGPRLLTSELPSPTHSSREQTKAWGTVSTGHVCANKCVSARSGHEPRLCLQPSSLGTQPFRALVSPPQKQMLSVPTPSSSYRLGHNPGHSPSLAPGPWPQVGTSSLARSASNPLGTATHWVKVLCKAHKHNPGRSKCPQDLQPELPALSSL